MSGSEQGDYSRMLFERRRHYSAVRMQQGRVLLDSDWNAQMELLAERLRTETRDTVGVAGGPAAAAGFAIEAEAVLDFDSSGRWMTIELAELTESAGASGLSFAARLNPRAAAATGAAATLLTVVGRGDGGPAVELTLELDRDGRLLLRRPAGVLASTARLVFGHFQHVAVVLTRHETTLYLDGAPVAGGGGGLAGGRASHTLVFGAAVAAAGGGGSGFEGLLLDLRLWNRALAAEEVGREAADASTDDASTDDASTDDEGIGDARDSGLIGSWRFTRPGASVEDEAGSGRRWQLCGDPGRAPTWRLRGIYVGRGRYYVGGLLCENERRVPFDAQPDAPGSRLPQFDREHAYLFYLDAWEQTVTAVQDPALREIALADADTTVRTRTVAPVKVLALPLDISAGAPDPAEVWRRLLARERASGRLRARSSPSAQEPGNFLYRVEIHSTGGRYGWPRALAEGETALAARAEDGSRLRLDEAARGGLEGWHAGDLLELWREGGEGAGATAAIAAIDPASGLVELAPESLVAASGASAGGELVTGAGLRLRRIATFKWSRQNASVVFALAGIEPGGEVVTLADPGRRELDLEPGDWVEYLDDETLLSQAPRALARVEAIDPALLQLTLSRPAVPAGGRVQGHPALRRWDQKGTGDATAAKTGVLLARTGWLPLESGIEVSFEGDGPYRAGDYWWMPARSRDASISWPEVEEDGQVVPAACPPRGIEHARAPLAVLALTAAGLSLADCRKTFHPLADGAVSKAGDTMYGPLVVRSHITVEGGGPADPGAVSAEVFYGPLGSPGSVATANLAHAAVTHDKLAPNLGIVPPGYAILGPTPRPPHGYAWTGSAFPVFQPFAAWRERAPLPRTDPGPLRGAAIAGRLFVVLESGELFEYEPASDRWHARCRRPGNLQSFAVAASDRLFVVGGLDPRLGKSGSTLIYDPASDRWTSGQEMPTPRSHLALASLGGRLYALGGLARGWLGERVSRANEEYDPDADRWTRRSAMPARRYDPGAGGAGTAVHVFGGVSRPWFGLWGRAMPTDHHEYHPASDRWQRRSVRLAYPCAHPGTQAVEDHLFACGGEGALGPLDTVLELDPSTGTWHDRPPLARPSAWVAAGEHHGSLLAETGSGLLDLPVATRYYIHRKG